MQKRPLKATTVAVSALDEQTIHSLYGLLNRYYADINQEQFCADLANKDHIILLQNDAAEILGFSTLQVMSLDVDGHLVRGVFSGDTVIDASCWGQGVLGVAFLKYLFWQRVKSPLTPLYWCLVSKGYKTYLLMANNFPNHFPRYEKATPAYEQNIMHCFARQLFQAHYQEDQGLVIYPSCAGHIKPGIASIDAALRAENARIDFFATKNPSWDMGAELVCLAEMTWLMPLQYWLKKQFQRARKRFLPSKAHPAKHLSSPHS
jgi:hypothetical protein